VERRHTGFFKCGPFPSSPTPIPERIFETGLNVRTIEVDPLDHSTTLQTDTCDTDTDVVHRLRKNELFNNIDTSYCSIVDQSRVFACISTFRLHVL